MYKHLYEIFKQWYRGGSIYFYSDPHFGDLITYSLRFPKELEEETQRQQANFTPHLENGSMVILNYDFTEWVSRLDEMQVKRINSVVHKHDTIIFLGDIGDVEYIKKLKAGYKVLIMGNHDRGASNYKRIIEWVSSENPGHYIIRDNKLFDEVYEGPLTISDKILLSHEPVKYEFALNIHGHDHNGKNDLAFLKFNVCAEKINYTPVMLKAVIESGMLKSVPNIHREVIDKASAKARKKIV